MFRAKNRSIQNFSLEKLDHHLVAKIHGKSNDNILEKQCLDPEMDLDCLKWAKNLKFTSYAWKEVKPLFQAKFYGKSNGDSLVARKRCVLTQSKWDTGKKGFFQPLLFKNQRLIFSIYSLGGLICIVIYH